MKSRLITLIGIAVPFSGFSATHNPDSAQFYLQKALVSKQLKRVPEAENNFKRAIEFNPDDFNLRIAYGSFLIEHRKYFAAIDQFHQIQESGGESPIIIQKLLEVSFCLNRWNDVITYGTKANLPATGTRNNYMLGKAYFEEEDYGLSEKQLVLAIQQNPTDFDALTLLGKVYVEISDYKQAISTYNLALNLNGDNPNLLYELGLLYSTINKEQEAVKYIELAAEKGYKVDLDYKQNLGMAYLGFDTQKGIEILTKVLEKKPNDSEILFQIGQAHYKSKNFELAADTFNKVYLKDPTNSKALYMMGIAYQRKGDKALGISYCQKAILQDPELRKYYVLKYSTF